MSPQPGDYFVVETNGPVAKAIRFAERHWLGVPAAASWANHCGVYTGDGLIVEANVSRRYLRFRGSVERSVASKYAEAHILWSSEELTPEERELVVGAAEAMVGIPYSFLDIAAMMLERVPGLLGKAARDRLDRGDRLICSQVVARTYRVAGRVLVPWLADNFVSPGHLCARAMHLTPRSVPA